MKWLLTVLMLALALNINPIWGFTSGVDHAFADDGAGDDCDF